MTGHLEEALRQIEAEKNRRRVLRGARDSFAGYVAYDPPSTPYLYGRHTYAIINACQQATEAVERGESYRAIVCVPPRHGKTDLVSRRYLAWHLGRNPNHECLLVSYSGELATELSRAALRSFRKATIEGVFDLSLDTRRPGHWSIEGHTGRVSAVGIGGSITGRGADVCIIDDYCKNRQEAESLTVREHAWDAFRADILSRRAPASAYIIVATRWHTDDIVGRILKRQAEDPDFPVWRYMRFPAQAEDGSYLFPERFATRYYEEMKALGSYDWQCLFQNDPQPRGGNMLRADNVRVISAEQVPSDVRLVRAWDLASTAKERHRGDPDYTVGTLAGYRHQTREVFVADVVRGQWSATERDRIIYATALADRQRGVEKCYIESVAGYKDTQERMKRALSGVVVVRGVTPERDKVSRASVLEAAFEAGLVHVVRAPWNEDWLAEMSAFPSGAHDDQVDSLVLAVYDAILGAGDPEGLFVV